MRSAALRRVIAGLGVFGIAVVAAGLLLPVACSPDHDFRPGVEHLHRIDEMAWAPALRPDSLLVVSYNVQYGEDVAVALNDLRRAGLDRPDILLVQEMNPAGIDTLAGALALDARYQPAAIHRHHERRFGNAVLSRWPILSHELLVLPHGHPLTGDRRIALACDIDVHGRIVRVISVHLATVILGSDRRFEQAAAVVDSLVSGDARSVVVGGDFNTATEAEVRRLRRLYRDRARLRPAKLGPDCTIGWHPGRLLNAGCRLDHIFMRGLAPGTGGVATDALASDHYPIWSWVRWPADRGGTHQ
ncbi:hypothetical protein GF314_05150 [bacterium]|nr:hypothetical protein [bacterium]